MQRYPVPPQGFAAEPERPDRVELHPNGETTLGPRSARAPAEGRAAAEGDDGRDAEGGVAGQAAEEEGDRQGAGLSSCKVMVVTESST